MADSTWVRREGREGGEEEEEEGREDEGGVLDASRLFKALVRRREMKRSSLFLVLVLAGGRRVAGEAEGAWRCSRRVARTLATCSSVARKVRMSTVLFWA